LGDQKIKIVRPGAKTWNPTLGAYEFGPPSEIPVTGVTVPYATNLINGTTIQASDVRLVITNDVEPLMDDKVLVDGKQYSVVRPEPASYTGAELSVVYKAQLRG
jgi:primase-polymerase (primpol)-like protein